MHFCTLLYSSCLLVNVCWVIPRDLGFKVVVAVLHSHQQCVRVLTAPHPHPHLAIPVGVDWYLIVAFPCISFPDD